MSGFDDNPFGEPIVDNPFADPAVQQVTRNTANIQNSLEDYNPFEADNTSKNQVPQKTSGVPVVQPSTQHTIINTGGVSNSGVGGGSNINRTDYSTSGGGGIPQITTEELQRQKEELDRKAAELDRREQQLQGNLPRLNNWPPLPDKCCFQPCFYQDINVDIPSEFQRIVRNLYYVWMFYTLTMCVNIIGGFIIVFHKGDFTTFGLSLLYAFLFTPASYLCWFRPAYKAFRSDSSFNFMVFFFVFFFQMIISIFQTIGIPQSGYCGFILALSQFDSSASGILVGILLLLIAVCFGTCAAVDLVLLTKIHAIYRSSGASMAKAQAEFTNEFMRNQHVQQAAASAMSTAVNSQLNNRY